MNYIELQIACTSSDYPTEQQFQRWVDVTLDSQSLGDDTEILIRLVDSTESADLNQQYRHKSGATNILSFPFDAPAGMEMDHVLGDLILCVPLIIDEAKAQNKLALHHWAHITIHGVLHLLGYDHIKEADAKEMENLEINILAQLNIVNPYLPESMP